MVCEKTFDKRPLRTHDQVLGVKYFTQVLLRSYECRLSYVLRLFWGWTSPPTRCSTLELVDLRHQERHDRKRNPNSTSPRPAHDITETDLASVTSMSGTSTSNNRTTQSIIMSQQSMRHNAITTNHSPIPSHPLQLTTIKHAREQTLLRGWSLKGHLKIAGCEWKRQEGSSGNDGPRTASLRQEGPMLIMQSDRKVQCYDGPRTALSKCYHAKRQEGPKIMQSDRKVQC